ncbi:hypothetical protein [Pleionea sp. CnH1-48]|uniref:hypothetical protein n=1 Tax=Pleionea sp. CnH1-48 TaxID=2954494 RepID=UPI0020975719|nr:hypothetical protein [Pleionea sp. CnH1-48]MCO7226771.1 hypothetical protein [Pleionea sp. CnH1-48]
MDLTDELLGDCSPYISDMIYDIDVRMVFIECMFEPKKQEPALRIVFPDITHYSETSLLDDPDDEVIDDIVSIIQVDEETISITTYKKEMTLKLAGEPFIEDI